MTEVSVAKTVAKRPRLPGGAARTRHDPRAACRRSHQRFGRRRTALRAGARRRSPRAWATAFGLWRSSPRKSVRRRGASRAQAATASGSESSQVTNGGDETDLVVAFNEQVLLGRVRAGELKPGCIILLESMWRDDADPKIAASYTETYDRLVAAGYHVLRDPDGARVPHASWPTRGAGRTCSRWACCATSTAWSCSWRASRSRSRSARRPRG